MLEPIDEDTFSTKVSEAYRTHGGMPAFKAMASCAGVPSIFFLMDFAEPIELQLLVL